jgi:PAS domain S-box-containing protein
MSADLFEALKRYSGFRAEDGEVLRRLHPAVRGRFPGIVEDFYRRITLDPATRRILNDPDRIERLKLSLGRWLDEVFLGPHDASYVEKRLRIGSTHVQVGLPQAYVFAAMSGIRLHLRDGVLEKLAEEDPDLARQGIEAVTKILDLDLALIAGSYHEAEKYRDVVEFAPEMIHHVDREGRIASVNRTELERLGYGRDEIVGRKLEDIVAPEDRPAIRAHLEAVFSKGESRCEVRLVTARGDILDVEILATGVRSLLDGAVEQSRGYVRDVSERKRAEAALRMEKDAAQKYLDVAGAIICVIGADGRFMLMNRKGCEVLGCSEEEVIGRSFEAFVPKASRSEVRAMFDRLMAGDLDGHEFAESPVLKKGGEERVIQWHNTVLRDPEGKVTGALNSGVDVTERRRAEKAFVEQASLVRLGEMAAVVAHEVKNPLAGIGGAVQVLSGQLPAGSAGRAIAQEILERLDALNGWVDDLLVFARPRPPRKAPVPIRTLFEDTVSLVLQDPRLSGVKVETRGEDVIVEGDPELLKPAFINILLNAAQAMGGDGRISIAVERENEGCRVSIADTGPGIPPDVRERIFEPFFSTKHRGTGLGLPITKRVIEAHGGEIGVACPGGGGTTVSLRLPLGARLS